MKKVLIPLLTLGIISLVGCKANSNASTAESSNTPSTIVKGIDKVTITINLNGGTTTDPYEPITLTEGTLWRYVKNRVPQSVDFGNEFKVFQGFSLSLENPTVISDTYAFNKDETIYAFYTVDPSHLKTVKFISHNNKTDVDQTFFTKEYVEGENLAELVNTDTDLKNNWEHPTAPVEEGRTYEEVSRVPDALQMVEDGKLEYRFNFDDKTKFTVTLDANGGKWTDHFVEYQEITYMEYAHEPDPAPQWSGHTFEGWFDNAEGTGSSFDFGNTPITENKHLYAKFSVIKRHVAFKYKTSATEWSTWGEEQDVEIGGYVKMPGTNPNEEHSFPEKGHAFIGWFLDQTGEDRPFSPNMPVEEGSGDFEIYAHFATDITKYTVTFVVTEEGSPITLDETFAGTNPDIVPWGESYGESEADLPKTERRGYDFIGWYENKQGEGTDKLFDPTTPIKQNYILYAHWGEEKHYETINLDPGLHGHFASVGEHNPISEKFYVGETPYVWEELIPDDPTGYGAYTFAYWYDYDDPLKQPKSFQEITDPYAGPTTYVAKWTFVPNVITATFRDASIDDETLQIISVQTLYTTETTYPIVTRPTDPADKPSDHLVFDNWYTTKEDSTTFDFNNPIDPALISDNNVNIWAHWKQTYTITFETGSTSAVWNTGGSDPISREYLPGATPDPGAQLIWNDSAHPHEFLGWHAASADPGVLGINPVTDHDEIYTAVWKDVTPYTITFHVDDSTSFTQTVITGGKVIRPVDPTKTDYVFKDWYTNSSFSGNPYDFDTEVTESFDLYAKFEHRQMTLTFDTQGGTPSYIEPIKADYEGKVLESQKPTNPTRGEEIFQGWFYDSDGDGTVDTEFKFAENADDPNATIVTGDWLLVAQFAHAAEVTITLKAGNGNWVNINDAEDKLTEIPLVFTYEAQIPDYSTENATYNEKTWHLTPVTNYAFTGWKDDAGGTYAPNALPLATRSVTYTAVYEEVPCDVEFYAVDPTGTVTDPTLIPGITQHVKSGEKAVRPSESLLPTYERYVFADWYESPTAVIGTDTPFNFENTPITEHPKKLYAIYKDAPLPYYDVKFYVVDPGTGQPAANPIVTQHVIENGYAVKPSEDILPDFEGKVFKDWYNNAEGTGDPFNFTATPITAETSIYAIYMNTPAPTHYDITFFAIDPTGTETEPIAITDITQTVEVGKKIVRPSDSYVPSYEEDGYVFKDWYTTPEPEIGVDNPYDFDTAVAENSPHVLYAIYETAPTPPTTYYDVTFYDIKTEEYDPDNPEWSDSPIDSLTQHIADGGYAFTPSGTRVPTHDGFKLAGWLYDSDGDDKPDAEWNFDTMTVTAATKLYAKFVYADVTLTFKYSDGTVIKTVDDAVVGSDMSDYIPTTGFRIIGSGFGRGRLKVTGWQDAEGTAIPSKVPAGGGTYTAIETSATNIPLTFIGNEDYKIEGQAEYSQTYSFCSNISLTLQCVSLPSASNITIVFTNGDGTTTTVTDITQYYDVATGKFNFNTNNEEFDQVASIKITLSVN